MPQKQTLTGKEAQTNVNLPLFLDFWILVKYANMPKYGNINKAMVSKEKQPKKNQKIISSKLGFVWQQLFSCLFNFLFSSLHQQTGKFRFFILHRISVLHIYLYFFIWKYIWGNERPWLPAYWAGKECFLYFV